MRYEIDSEKHRNNLLKTVEGTAWILCDAITNIAEQNIVPDGSQLDSQLAQNISEIYEIISECEEPAVIENTADKLLEFAGDKREQVIAYIKNYMGDNPLSEIILSKSNRYN